jgi:hypothetical protein
MLSTVLVTNAGMTLKPKWTIASEMHHVRFGVPVGRSIWATSPWVPCCGTAGPGSQRVAERTANSLARQWVPAGEGGCGGEGQIQGQSR